MAQNGDNGGDQAAGEIAKLRAENEALKAKLETGEEPAKKRGGFWRSFVVWLLVILASLFAFSGVLSVWLKTTLLDTNTFVRTIAPIVSKPAVASAVSTEAVNALWKQYEIETRVKEAFKKLPPELDFVSGPVASGLKTAAQKAAEEILKSKQFQFVWEKILRLAHETAVKTVTGKGAVEIDDEGTVVLDLSDLINEIKKDLVDRGMTFLKDVNVPNAGRIKLFESSQLGMVKQGVDLLETLAWVLPFLALVCFGAAILISVDHRKATLGSAVGLSIAAALVLIALGVTRVVLLGQVKKAANREAALQIWNQLLHGLKVADGALLAFGVVVAIACILWGPAEWAVKFRAWVAARFQAARERRKGGEVPVGPVGRFISAHTWGMRAGGVAVALLILLLSPLSLWLLLVIVILLLIYLAVLELLR